MSVQNIELSNLLHYNLYMFFPAKQIIACKNSFKRWTVSSSRSERQECGKGQRSISLLTILIPEATNVWLLPRIKNLS